MADPIPHGISPAATRPWPVFASLSGWRRGDLGPDLFAGLTLAAIAVPECMATARLGNLSPLAGLIAFAAGSIAFAAFGRNRLLSCGADSTITPIFAASLAALAASGSAHYAALAAAFGAMVGLILIVAGALRAGWIANLLSVPVTTGFLAGIAAHIIISQLAAFLGLTEPGGGLLAELDSVANGLGSIAPWPPVLGLAVLLLAAAGERIGGRLPGALIGVAGATAATAIFHLGRRGVATIGAVGGGAGGLAIPPFAMDELLRMLPVALLVAVVVTLQTAATARAFPPPDGGDGDLDRDLIGVGAGSLLAGLAGGFAVDASPPRTAIVAESGGRSQLAGLAAALLVLAIVGFGGGVLGMVPLPALAGLLMFVAIRLVRLPTMIAVYRQAPSEFALIIATVAAMVALPLEIGAAIAIGLSLLHGMWTAGTAKLIEFEHVPGTSIWWPTGAGRAGKRLAGVAVLAFQAPLSFLNAREFRRAFLARIADPKSPPRLVVLEAGGIAEIDYTAAAALSAIVRECRDRGIAFAVARLESVRAQRNFERFGLEAQIGADHVFLSVDEAIKALGPAR